MFDRNLSKKFLEKLNTMSFEQIQSRADKASPCGMEPILKDYTILNPSVREFVSLTDEVDYLSGREIQHIMDIIMTEIPKEHQVGKVAVADGKFYTPKYWVTKLKTDSDVLIQTAHKSLNDCQRITEDFYADAVDKDEVVYILIEIRNPPILFE